jgi:hypothetical protein
MVGPSTSKVSVCPGPLTHFLTTPLRGKRSSASGTLASSGELALGLHVDALGQSMQSRRRWSAISLLAAMATAASWTSTAAQQQNADARVLAEFTGKVEAYDTLRKELAKKAPPLEKTDDPAEIAEAEKALAQQIKAARASAKPGDIFTPATQRVFRRLLNPTLQGDEGVENKTAINKDRPPASKIPFQVNGEYPKEQPLSTVPPDILKALPPLPENVQYRIAGKHLLLYCTRGNLIVDYMLNAIP